MKFAIKHEIKGRIRIHLAQKRMTYRQADILQCYLEDQANISKATVYVRTQDVAVTYTGSRDELIRLLSRFSYETAQVAESALENSGRELNETYKEKLINSVVLRALNKMFLPYSVRVVITTEKSVKYIYHGVRTLMKGKLEVPVLDATAIGVSMLRGDFNTAGSTMFLLGIGEILEEWTHKKSVNDLARSMSINAEKVWFVNEDGQEVLVPVSSIKAGDLVRVHMGNVIPFDGNVVSGEAMVNQTSLTGESAPVRKAEGSFAYAGTVLEEGEITVKVKEAAGSSRYEKIVSMIEDSEKLKSSVERNAEHLADRLVPYTLAGTGVTYLLTRNVTKTLAVLMVDFSCALKLAMPISVLSAIREASTHSITVKGGKYMEAMSEATTIVFDKTGTLTKAKPVVSDVVSFSEELSPDELLRIAACMEEHFPHSMAGITKVVMMTGGSERTAAAIAKRVGVDEYYSEVLPEDKASFVEKEKELGNKVIMIGDGINDSLALSSASVGIAISDGAAIAREIADVTISADNLHEIVTLKRLSTALMKRIHNNYRTIIGVNGGLIALGVAGVIMPTTSALLHNLSTLTISLRSMRNYLPKEEEL